MRSLVNAIHDSHCWYCGDGIQDDDEQCDTGDDLSECSSSPCQNGGECYDGIRQVLGNHTVMTTGLDYGTGLRDMRRFRLLAGCMTRALSAAFQA